MNKFLPTLTLITVTGLFASQGALAQTETRDLDEFDSVDFSGQAELTFKLGETPSVHISAPQGKLQAIETEVDGQWLEIYTPDSLGSSEIKIDVVATALREVILEGATESRFIGITGPEFVLDVSGANEINFDSLLVDNIEFYAQGATELVSRMIQGEQLDMELGGASDVDLGDVNLPNVNIDSAGAASIRANGNIENLDLQLAGAGEFIGDQLEVRNLTGDVSMVSEVRIASIASDMLIRDSLPTMHFGFDFDGDMDNAINQAMLIGIISTLMVFLVPLLIVLAVLWNGHRKRKMMHETIRIYAENGRELPPEMLESLGGASRTPEQQIRKGVIQIGVGVGLALFFTMVGAPEAAGIGLLVACIGGARFYVGRTEQKREDARNAA